MPIISRMYAPNILFNRDSEYITEVGGFFFY